MSAPHCPSCTCGKRAPVQDDMSGDPRPGGTGTISWAEHLAAYAAYARKYGRSQTAERIAERGGFGWRELAVLLEHEPKTWVPS